MTLAAVVVNLLSVVWNLWVYADTGRRPHLYLACISAFVLGWVVA